MPAAYTPMPLRRRPDPFDDPAWIFELKWDGFRALAHLDAGSVRLVSRRGLELRRFAPLAAALGKELRAGSAVLDGEIVCLDSKGRPQFRELLRGLAAPVFVAFDLLAIDGEDLRDEPLLERKRLLRAIVPTVSTCALYAQHLVGHGVALFALACAQDLEGIVAKRADSPYQSDRATWWKIKNPAYSQAVGRHDLFQSRGRG